MKVLLIITDLYKSVGGGQTVYKKIVQATPDVDFFYFRDNESEDAPRPVNAKTVKLLSRRKIKILSAPPFPEYRRSALEEADRYARSVAGQQFDIVDIPDFYTFGSMLRDAFAHHGVKCDRIVLAMHGNISVSMEMQWGSAGNNVLEQRTLERAQFDTADGIYAISPRYIKEWQAYNPRKIHYIDPINFVDRPSAVPTNTSTESAELNLYCIGRMERRKGNDLFVEIVRWLGRDIKAWHVGEQDYSYQGIASGYLLEQMAKHRDVEIGLQGSFNRKQLSQVFASKSFVLLPVRYDTLNLVALEALFSGCPTAISSEAGVCDYLDSAWPELPYIKIDFNNFYGVISKLKSLLRDYDINRRQLAEALKHVSARLNVSLKMADIYAHVLTDIPDTQQALLIEYEEIGRSTEEQMRRTLRSLLPVETYHELKGVIRAPKHHVAHWIKELGYFGDGKFYGIFVGARHIPYRLCRIANHSEYNHERLREKLDEIYGNAGNPVFRCNFWLDIARIERLLDNDLFAVAYELRVLRLVGSDRFGILTRVLETLNRRGMVQEAKAAEAFYRDPVKAEENVYHYLKEAYKRNLNKPELPLEYVDDRRKGDNPKVSVIVSLYKAASKLKVFLTALIQQSLVKQGQVEVILVDSGSPDKEYKVIQEYWRDVPINATYVRSDQRETIQAAWNRGIQLARAPYLVFLGVDETLYPEGLEVLAKELDDNPGVDWVMANSLVTAVDERGVFKNDVMVYDRAGATRDHSYLETCFLSWVGGMYRKTIHERFGYYDESFAAAGDTEFKNRVLSHIKVKFVPRMLGLFLNYPDERTTASPKAEIEDLRAWYIHRSPGGVRYAFENRPEQEAEQLLGTALGYRKSYCRHLSSDIEYAAHLANYLIAHRKPDDWVKTVAPHLRDMLGNMRSLEFAGTFPRRLQTLKQLVSLWRMASHCQSSHAKLLTNRNFRPCYKVFNDNRYEQHSWLWKSN